MPTFSVCFVSYSWAPVWVFYDRRCSYGRACHDGIFGLGSILASTPQRSVFCSSSWVSLCWTNAGNFSISRLWGSGGRPQWPDPVATSCDDIVPCKMHGVEDRMWSSMSCTLFKTRRVPHAVFVVPLFPLLDSLVWQRPFAVHEVFNFCVACQINWPDS